MPYFNTDELTIHYEVSKLPEAPWLVLSNSLGANLSMWDLQLPAMAPHFNVLRYDNRGHGQSSVPEGPYTIELLAQDVIALCDHVGAHRFHFCGLSMGGAVGQWLGMHQPDRIERLVLCDTAQKFGRSQSWSDRIAMVEREGLEAVVAGGVIARWFRPTFAQSHPELVGSFRAAFLAQPPAGYVACCAVLRDLDFRESPARIPVPTLVVCGTEDPVTPVEDGQRLVNSIENARMLQLEAAHLSNVEAAEQFNRAVLDFLQAGASS